MSGSLVTALVASWLCDPGSAAAQVTDWAAITSGRMIDIYDVERSDEHMLASGLSMVTLAAAVSGATVAERRDIAASAHYRVEAFIDVLSTDTQVLIVRDSLSAVVAVRGSQQDADWLVDAAIVTAPGTTFPNAHLGFSTAASSVLPQVQAQLDLLLESGVREIWVTGHSLGGAVSQLIGWRLDQLGYPVEGIVSFGAPAVGKDGWHAAYAPLHARTQRWETDEDIIPCFPDNAQWRLNGRLHVLGDSGVSLDQLSERCLDIPTGPIEAEVFCGEDWSQVLGIFFGLPPWSCDVPDIAQVLTDLLANIIAGHDTNHHERSAYEHRLELAIPRLIAPLTGA